MSRARLFQRAANWLKNCIKTKEQVQQVKDRRRAFKFAFGQLEERVVLDAHNSSVTIFSCVATTPFCLALAGGRSSWGGTRAESPLFASALIGASGG